MGQSAAKAAVRWGREAVEPPPPKAEYSREGFYTRASDHHGHSRKFGINFPPDLYHLLMKTVDAFPDYDIIQDLARDAIVHLMEMRKVQLADPAFREAIDKKVREIAFSNFVETLQWQVERWEKMHETLETTFVGLAEHKAWDILWTACNEAEVMADPCPEPYRSETFDFIERWREKVPKAHWGARP